jgi:hypothetical protein
MNGRAFLRAEHRIWDGLAFQNWWKVANRPNPGAACETDFPPERNVGPQGGFSGGGAAYSLIAARHLRPDAEHIEACNEP